MFNCAFAIPTDRQVKRECRVSFVAQSIYIQTFTYVRTRAASRAHTVERLTLFVQPKHSTITNVQMQTHSANTNYIFYILRVI